MFGVLYTDVMIDHIYPKDY